MRKQSAMQRWEEQQRLKLMSKKIASVKSVLKTEKRLGEGGRRTSRGPSPLGTPNDSGDTSQNMPPPEQKQRRGKRPEWQEICHVSYKQGSSQPRQRVRPGRISVVETPDSARNVLMRGLERIEEVVERAKKSPKKNTRNVAGHFEELQALRSQIAGTKKGPKSGGGAAAVPKKEEGGAKKEKKAEATWSTPEEEKEEVEGLRQSINALSCILDSKIAELREEEEDAVRMSDVREEEVGAEGQEEAASPSLTRHREEQRINLDVSADICLHTDDSEEEEEEGERGGRRRRERGVRRE